MSYFVSTEEIVQNETAGLRAIPKGGSKNPTSSGRAAGTNVYVQKGSNSG